MEMKEKNQKTLDLLEKERKSHEEESTKLKTGMNAFLQRMVASLKDEDILEGKEKGCAVDKRTCHACKANLVNSLAKEVGVSLRIQR